MGEDSDESPAPPLDGWAGAAVAVACTLAVIGMGFSGSRARESRRVNAAINDSAVANPPSRVAPPIVAPPPPAVPAPLAQRPAPSIGGRGNARYPTIRNSPPLSVKGSLPAEVVNRIVRQNFGRLRLCYEGGLRGNPQLAGNIVVKFVIGRDGTVSTAMDGGSTLSDQSVVRCVVRAFGTLSFPPPDGIETVTYPIAFANE